MPNNLSVKRIIELDNAGMSGRDIAIALSISRNSVAYKTYLSCVLAKEACKKDIRTFTIRLPELIQKRSDEKVLHRENKFLNKLASFDLLVIDE